MAKAIDIYASADPPPSCADAEVSEESMELIVSQIRQICRDSSLEFALRVGAVVIHNFYDGDINAWRGRGPKLHSFRRLARHPDLPMSPAALYRCVAIFELCERLNAAARWRRLGASHFRTVLGLTPDVQEQLLATANKHQWAVKALHAAALQTRSAQARRGGRKPEVELVRTLTRIGRGLEDCKSDVENDLASLDDEELQRTTALLTRAREWIENISQIVERREKTSGGRGGSTSKLVAHSQEYRKSLEAVPVPAIAKVHGNGRRAR